MEDKLDAIMARLAAIEAGMSAPARAYVDTVGAAEYSGLSKVMFEEWRSRTPGGPAYIKVGKRVLYSIADLNAFLVERRVEAMQ